MGHVRHPPATFGLRGWLLLLVLCCTLPLTGAIVAVALETRRITAEEATERLYAAVERAGLAIDLDVAQARAIVVAAGVEAAHVIPWGDRCNERMAMWRARHPLITTVIVADLEGRAVCAATPIPAGLTIREHDYFLAALASPGSVVGKPLMGLVKQHPVLPIGAAIRDASGVPIGVMVATVDLPGAVAKMRQQSGDLGLSFTLYDPEGLILGRAPDAAGLTGKTVHDSEIFKTLLRGVDRPKGDAVVDNVDGSATVVAFSVLPIDEQVLWLTAGAPAASLFGEVDGALHNTLVAAAVVTALCITLGFIIWEITVHLPLVHLARAAEALATDAGSVELRFHTWHSREVVQIGRHIETAALRRWASARAFEAVRDITILPQSR